MAKLVLKEVQAQEKYMNNHQGIFKHTASIILMFLLNN